MEKTYLSTTLQTEQSQMDAAICSRILRILDNAPAMLAQDERAIIALPLVVQQQILRHYGSASMDGHLVTLSGHPVVIGYEMAVVLFDPSAPIFPHLSYKVQL